MHYYHEYWPNKMQNIKEKYSHAVFKKMQPTSILNTVFPHAMEINGGQVIMAKITSLCCLLLQYL